MFIWTKESMEWMSKANDYTGYFPKVKDLLMPYLKPDDTILEIACGTGHLAQSLSYSVKEVIALDISHLAVDFTKEQLNERKIENVTALCDDWKNIALGVNPALNAKKIDLVIFSYFGAILENFSLLSRFSPRTIIAILPYSKFNSRYSNSKGDNPGRKKETVENIVSFLDKKKIPFQLIEKELEFGQPFSSYEDALRYTSHYYNHYTQEEARSFLEKTLVQENGTIYLPNKKHIGIFIIHQ